MEMKTPPSSARRNPPRRAKSAAAATSVKKRPLPSKLLTLAEEHPLLNLAQPTLFLSTKEPVSNPTEENAAYRLHSTVSAEKDAQVQTLQGNGQAEKTLEKNEVLPAREENVLNNDNNNNPACNINPAVKNLEIFLRIRPAKPMEARRSVIGIPKGSQHKRKTQILGREEEQHICLHANDSHSVTLTPPLSLLESKRAKTEVYTGFSHVFLPHSSQEDVYETVMHPLIDDFVAGTSCLLVAMGPTCSGKTHTMFGNFAEPGLIPRALKKLLARDENNDFMISRSYFFSMFEIYSERGRGEKIIDLFQCGAELSIQQSNIKGLQEVEISSVEEAECLLTNGMEKRTTAATNANSQSSRSQCIINVRSRPKVVDGQRNEWKLGEAVLTIADLAGAEREKKTGNQGVRFNESNFINNTSMVFGLCLRALLEHQKNPKRALEKHYHNSLLTRYLKDYLEAKGRMVMVLNVIPGEENYADTSFVLRQASPYVNIKFTTPFEELPNFPRPKRSSCILSKGLQPRPKKFRLSQEHMQFKHGMRPSNHQVLVRRKIEDKAHVEDFIAFDKDRNFSSSLSTVHAPVQDAEHTHIRESSSVINFSEEQHKEKISRMEVKVNVEDSIAFGKDEHSSGSLLSVHALDRGEEQTHVRGSSSVLASTEEQFKERVSTMKGKGNVEDFIGQVEEQTHIRDFSVLSLTEEQLKERISFEVEERHERLMAVYEMSLSNVLKEHQTKVKMMEKHAEGLELELKKEKEHSLELSNEVAMLKEHCACLECENEKLQMAHKSGNIIMHIELDNENSKPFLIPLDVGCQNPVKHESAIRSACNNKVVEGEDKAFFKSCKACSTVAEEEESCTDSENNESGEVNFETSFSDHNKSGCSSGNGLGAFESVTLHEESIAQPCKDKVYLPGFLEYKQVTISKCEETVSSPVSEDCHNQNNHADKRHDMIANDNFKILLAWGNESESLTEEEQSCLSGKANRGLEEESLTEQDQSCVSGKAKRGLEEESLTKQDQSRVSGKANRGVKKDEDNLLQTNEKDDMDTVSGIISLEKFSIDLVEGGEVGTSQNRNTIKICESVPDKECCTHCKVNGVLKENVENLPETNEKENNDSVAGTDTLETCSIVPVEGAEIGTSQNRKEIETHEGCNCLSGAKSNLKRGRMLASLLNRKVDDGMRDINKNTIESLEELKATTESYTTSEDNVGPIGQCLEELLCLSLSEIENGLWKGDIECKRKISDLLERHGGILDIHSFKKSYSQQKCLSLRYCFSLICNKISNDKQWVTLSEDINPKSRQKIFWAIVKAQTVGKAASHARQGLQQEGLFKNTNNSCHSPGGLIEAQDSQIYSGSSYQANFPSKTLLLHPENLSVGNCVESLECNKENLCSSTKSPRRKLLPAPSMLVKGVDGGTVEDEIPKVVDRSFKKNSSAERVVGTRGRMSLARLLVRNR